MARTARSKTTEPAAADLTRTVADRVREARAFNAPNLDLSNLGLREVPKEILELNNLVSLNLSENRISELPDKFDQLQRLTIVNLDGNPLVEIPHSIFTITTLLQLRLDRTRIREIPSQIANLQQLTLLSFSLSPIEHVPDEFVQLQDLTVLWLNHCRLTEFPQVILSCELIKTLILNGNDLDPLPEAIGRLSKLTFLGLNITGLRKVPDIFDRLPELSHLTLNENSISELPPSIRSLKKLTHLSLQGNPLPIPPEILQSPEPQHILDFYFSHITSGAPKIPLNEAKMVVVGQGGVGKTSLVKRLVGLPYDPGEDTTRGIWISPWDVGRDQDRLKINIWDFGGQEIMHATHQFFLTKRTLYILVLDSRQGEQESRLEYWLKIIQSFGGTSPIIVVCNKADENRLTLDETGLGRKYASIVGFATTVSCKSEEGISLLRDLALTEIRKLDHLHDLFLASWIAVKDELDSMSQKKYDYISFDDYERICRKHGVNDPVSQKTLVSFLHDLGIVLNFPDPTLEGTNILSPVWVTAGVYRILTWHLEGGILQFDQLRNILDPERYPPRQHLFIIGMMKKFELCFQFDDTKNLTYLVPDLLPKNEPDTGSWNDALQFQYHYEVLPSSVISRFIVRMNAFISNRTYWRNGVVIGKGGNRALVQADLEDRKIYIRVSGRPAGRRLLMDIIRTEFERIHATIPQLTAAEKVPMPDDPSIMVDYRHLLNLLELGEVSFVPEKSKQRYSVRSLLEGIETDERRSERREMLLEGSERPVDTPGCPGRLALPHRMENWVISTHCHGRLHCCIIERCLRITRSRAPGSDHRIGACTLPNLCVHCAYDRKAVGRKGLYFDRQNSGAAFPCPEPRPQACWQRVRHSPLYGNEQFVTTRLHKMFRDYQLARALICPASIPILRG